MKSLKYSALLVAAALYACPAWTLAQDPPAAASEEEAPQEDRAEGEPAGSDTADSQGPGSVDQTDTSDADDTAAGSGAPSGRKGKPAVRAEVEIGADADAEADPDAVPPAGQKNTYKRAKARGQAGAPATGARAKAGARGEATAEGQMSMDQHFVEGAASGNMLEVQAAKLAMTKSQSEEIKDFAQHIINDHTKANQQLMKIARSKQMEVPNELKPSHRGELQELRMLEGEMFDKAFVINNVGDHVKMILKFRDASENCEDADLKAYAAELLPGLQGHLEHAQKLAGWDEAMPADAGEHGEHEATADPDATADPAAPTPRPSKAARGKAAAGSTSGEAGVGDDAPESDAPEVRGSVEVGKPAAGEPTDDAIDAVPQGDPAEGEPAGSDTADSQGPGSVDRADTNDADDASK